jgi:hypothetical protein
MSDEQKTPPKQSPEEADFQERIEGFRKEMLPILGKYEVGIGAQAFILPDGRVGANPIFFSDRKKPQEAKEAKPAGLSEA